MSFEEFFSSKTGRILILILLLALIGVGVFFLLRSSDEDKNEIDSLEFGPKIDNKTFIHYDLQDRKSVFRVTKAIEEYLKPYNTTSPNLQKSCSFNNPPQAGKTCEIDLKSFDPCVKEKTFEYFQSQPCIFLKLAREAEFNPTFLNESRLPESMPSDLQELIKTYVKTDPKNAQFIWVSCDGKSDLDKKNIGAVRYLPRQGFPGFFYPCTSSESCTKPLVAVQFLRPKANEKIFVECKIWAGNFVDTVEFELMIDS